MGQKNNRTQYLADARELLEYAGRCWIAIRNGEKHREHLDEIVGYLYRVKSGAQGLRFFQVVDLTHCLQTQVMRARAVEDPPGTHFIQWMIQCNESLVELIEELCRTREQSSLTTCESDSTHQ